MNDEASDVVRVRFESSDLLSSVVVPDSELEIVGTWEGEGGSARVPRRRGEFISDEERNVYIARIF